MTGRELGCGAWVDEVAETADENLSSNIEDSGGRHSRHVVVTVTVCAEMRSRLYLKARNININSVFESFKGFICSFILKRFSIKGFYNFKI